MTIHPRDHLSTKDADVTSLLFKQENFGTAKHKCWLLHHVSRIIHTKYATEHNTTHQQTRYQALVSQCRLPKYFVKIVYQNAPWPCEMPYAFLVLCQNLKIFARPSTQNKGRGVTRTFLLGGCESLNLPTAPLYFFLYKFFQKVDPLKICAAKKWQATDFRILPTSTVLPTVSEDWGVSHPPTPPLWVRPWIKGIWTET